MKNILLASFLLAVPAAAQPPATLPSPSTAMPPENRWEKKIEEFEKLDRQTPPEPGEALFIGSSSINKWKTLAADFPGAKTVNRGFGGSHLSDCALFVERIIGARRPRLIVLYAGDNDLAAKKTPEVVFEEWKAFVERVRGRLPETPIAFISIKPSPARAHLLEKARTANGLIKAHIAGDKSLRYINVFDPMLGSDGQARPELFGPDKLHMTEAGYKLWQKIIAPHVSN